MKDNKLTEFEHEALLCAKRYLSIPSFDDDNFIENLRKIMPPTCTPNERKFFDLLRERSTYDSWREELIFVGEDGEYNTLKQYHFEGIDLKEFVRKIAE